MIIIKVGAEEGGSFIKAKSNATKTKSI